MATDNEHLARLTSVRNEMEAGIIIGALEQEGIQAAMSGVYTAGFRAEAPGWVEVLVAEDDFSQAQAILQQVRDQHADVDWSHVDVGEPEPEKEAASRSWMASLSVWRQIAQVLIVAYLIWLLLAVLFSDTLSNLFRASDV